MPSPTEKLKDLSTLIQGKVNFLFDESDGEAESGSALDQAGLINGKEIIHDFISHDEAGVAFDHLSYMINELELELSSTEWQIFKRLRAIYN